MSRNVKEPPREEPTNKSRYGRVSSKRKYNNDDLDNAFKDSLRSMASVLPKRSKTKSPLLVTNKFTSGDIVWAKIGKYPVWPGIIIKEPNTELVSKKENNVIMMHVYYFNDTYKRNWIKVNHISEFLGKKKLLEEYPKIVTRLSRSKLKMKWNRAADEAECLASMNKNNRVEAFFKNDFLPDINIPMMDNNQVKHHVAVIRNKPKAKSSTITIKEIASSTEFSSDVASNSVPNQNGIQMEHKSTSFENFPKDHPRVLIPDLCKLFYSNGWVTGTGGGISIKYNDQIFIAPSGVQKERMESDDLFVQDMDGVDIEVPSAEKCLSKSQCTPIFMCSFTERNAGAVIHIHSPDVVKLCLLNPENEIRVSDIEMIKGIYNEEKTRFYNNNEEVVIPIIENSQYERDLVDTFKLALINYPSTSAVLVRNHGMYVWGKDWKSAKTQCECYEFVFKIMVFKKSHNL